MLLGWFPPIPAWDGLHPAMVQFPLALLLLTPLLVLGSLLARTAWRPWALAGLLVATIGTLALWLASGTGHAAGQLVDKTPLLQAAILKHEALGVTARNVFTVLTLGFALVLLLPAWLRRELPDVGRVGALVVVLALYVGSAGVLAHAANAGGHLVHEQGVRAMLDPPVKVAEQPVAEETLERDRAVEVAR